MKSCKYCRSLIDDEAKICPHCRKNQTDRGWNIAVIIAVIVAVCVVIGTLSNLQQRKKENEAVGSTTYTTKPLKIDIQIGNIIKTKGMKITIKNIEFSYDVLPDKTDGFYTHYPADKGKVYIHIYTDITNTAKQNLPCDNIMKIKADYNNGYEYGSKTVPESTNSGFTFANITDIKPLDTLGVRFLIECPEEVAESKNSLDLSFLIDGTNDVYTYTIR